MRVCHIVLCFWLAALGVCAAADPDRAEGLSVHMLPDRVAQIDGHRGGFTAADRTYADAAQLIDYFRTLPAATQENGIWVVTTHPSSYSPAEHETLRALLALCQQHKIPIFTCRGAELPGGWKRSKVPSGWDASSDAQ